MMNHPKADDGVKKAKNIAAVLYLLVLAFLVGGSYINQQRLEAPESAAGAVPSGVN